MPIENTGKRDPLIHLLGSMAEGPSGYIEGMESDGQTEVVNSDMLPTDGPWDALEALGFVVGEVDKDDPIFRHCELPAGWSRGGTDHAMWSKVLDERGIERVSVFYKAAFYDRSAHCNINDVGYVLVNAIIYSDEPVAFPKAWALLTADERAAADKAADSFLERAEEHPDIYGDRLDRARQIKRFIEEN